MTILTKTLLNFLVRLSYKNSCGKFDNFSRRNSSFFLNNKALKSESLKFFSDERVFMLDRSFNKVSYCSIVSSSPAVQPAMKTKNPANFIILCIV